ncbi:MAG: sulfatase/phosphatase domain-containing protein, partial [Actinomycetota bacterium]
ETHEGGVTDPLIVHWPKKLAAKGEVRTQYLHSVDVMPTLLELVGVEPPSHIAGVEQQPIEGVSFAHTLGDPKAPSKHVTQCYEMLGSRALYHDGWKAVVFHQLPGLPGAPTYDGSDPNISFDVEQWELYQVETDIAETNDLAREHPKKLQEMIALWWSLAEKQQILPLNNQPGKFGDKRYRRERYEYRPGIGVIPPLVAPNLRNRSFEILADVMVPASGVEGAIIAQGSSAGGYAVYVKDKRLHYVHNFLDLYYFSVSAEVDVPIGAHALRVVFTSTGRFKGEVSLFYDDLPVATGAIPATVPVFFGVYGLTVGYLRGSSVIRGVDSPVTFTDSALQRVVVAPSGHSWRDPEGDGRVAMATQ